MDMDIDICLIGTLTQLFIKDSYNEVEFSKK